MATIAVIDDNPGLLDLVAEILEMDGHEVFATRLPSELLAHLAGGGVDLVITDRSSWPGEAIKQAIDPLLAAAGSVPVILFTALVRSVALEELAGALADVILKPCDIDDLTQQVSRVLATSPRARRLGRFGEDLGRQAGGTELFADKVPVGVGAGPRSGP